ERVGVRVVSDFRSRDVAAGGQGAPLVPLADVVLFGHAEQGRLLLNLGGIANVTFAPRRGVTGGAIAFDTGPGVGVVDAVTRRIDPAARFDAGGERARRGKPSRKVLDALLADPYFAAPPPKSTGRERFSPDYAARLIDDVKQAGGSDNDAVATATALTVETIARGIERWTPARASDEVVISGGGRRHPRLGAPLAAGVGGFIVFGGTREAVATLTRELREQAGRSLLIGADLERGPAQQVQGLTELPPPAALGWLDDLDATRTCGMITATEARAVG